jgi:hypothetical protein
MRNKKQSMKLQIHSDCVAMDAYQMKNCLGSVVSHSQAEEEPTNSAQYNPKEESSVFEEFQHCDKKLMAKR